LAKKKRAKNKTTYICHEGDREERFLKFLDELFEPKTNKISFLSQHSSGGNPDRVVGFALKECHRNLSVAWFDEDFDPANSLSQELRDRLMKAWLVPHDARSDFLALPMVQLNEKYNKKHRNPILIVSSPVCVESMILSIMGENCPIETYDPDDRDRQINILKDRVRIAFNGVEECEYYRDHFTVDHLEQLAETNSALKVLLSLFR